MIFFTSGVRSLPRRPIFLADNCLQNIGNTSDILILKSKSVSDLKLWHQNLLIILLLQRVNFIKCGEYSFGQKTVPILGTLIQVLYVGTGIPPQIMFFLMKHT
jgi:hypothetical protein